MESLGKLEFNIETIAILNGGHLSGAMGGRSETTPDQEVCIGDPGSGVVTGTCNCNNTVTCATCGCTVQTCNCTNPETICFTSCDICADPYSYMYC